MPYRCLRCLRVIEKFTETTATTFLLVPKLNEYKEKVVPAYRCPVCESITTTKPISIKAPLDPVPHCPHCHKVVDQLHGERTAIIHGTIRPGKTETVYFDSEYALYDGAFADEEGNELPEDPARWKLTCPHCAKIVKDPNECL